MMKLQQQATVCPVEVTLATIGEKWRALIVWYLLSGTKRLSD